MRDIRRAIKFTDKIQIIGSACFGGTYEGKGPLATGFDGITEDKIDGDKTWEKAESEMVERTVTRLLEKIGQNDGNIDLLLGGDLMNQCTSCAYGLEKFDIPYLGLYGACSTFAEGIMTGSAYVGAKGANRVIAVASSNFYTAERQYRFPISYGAFPQSTSQHTVTGCGAVCLEKSTEERGVFVTGAMPGIVIDRGVKNAANMGAAMASAAADTMLRFFKSESKSFSDYDLVATGDLGKIGREIAKDIMSEYGYTTDNERLSDCGTLIYDLENQDVSCGGSGCGCSATVFCSYIYPRLKCGELKKILLVGTGAMMSPQTLLQGLSIPAVAHLVEICANV